MNINRNLSAFFKGFGYAFSGLVHCIKNERNMRIHFCAAFYVLLFMGFYELTRAEKAVIYVVIALVISLEAVNTALEAAADKLSPERSPQAKTIKDCGAGAVLAAAVMSVFVAYELLWDVKMFGKIYEYFSENILMLSLLIVSALIWFIVIFLPSSKKTERNNKNV